MIVGGVASRLIVTDSDGRVTRINPAAEHLFGARTEMLGKPVELVVRDPGIAQSICDVLASHVPVVTEDAAAVLPRAVDGTRRAFRIRSTPMKDADGRLVGVVTLLEDITHLSEVSRLKSEFIAAASHELRTPLTSVQMGIHLLLESDAGTLDERQREILQLIAEGNTTKRLAQILNISVKTVETHRSQLMEQLDIHDVAGLVRYAIRLGLVTPEK